MQNSLEKTQGKGELVGWRAWRGPLTLFVVWRVGLAGLVFLAGAVIRPVARAGTAPYIVGNRGFWNEHLLAAWSRWDGEWYLQVAQYGYQKQNGTAAFFPLYPTLVKSLGWLCLGNYLLAAVIISGVATATVFVLLYELTRRDFGSKPIAISTIVYLALFPTAFFLPAVFTEALFMALVLAAFLCVRHLGRWWLAGLLLLLATLCRSLGILAVVPLIWEWWAQSRDTKRWGRENLFKLLPMVGLPALALAGWLAFNWLALGDPLEFLKAAGRVWHRQSAWPWQTLVQSFQTFLTPPPGSLENYNLLDFIFLVIFLTLFAFTIWLTLRRKYPVSYLLYFGLGMLLPLLAPISGEPLTSFPRYVLVIFPAFQVLALLLRRIPILDMLYTLIGAVGLAFLCSRFVQWYWVA